MGWCGRHSGAAGEVTWATSKCPSESHHPEFALKQEWGPDEAPQTLGGWDNQLEHASLGPWGQQRPAAGRLPFDTKERPTPNNGRLHFDWKLADRWAWGEDVHSWPSRNPGTSLDRHEQPWPLQKVCSAEQRCPGKLGLVPEHSQVGGVGWGLFKIQEIKYALNFLC